MKTIIKFSVYMLVMSLGVTALAQKKVQTIEVEHVINAPAEKVWKVIAEDFDKISNSHPKLVSSGFLNGAQETEVGCSRVCNYNDKGSKFLKETVTYLDNDSMTLGIDIFEVEGLPINPEYSTAVQKIVPIDDNSSKMIMTVNYRTKPSFLGGLAKGGFKKGIRDYGIAIEHHVNTGETVTKENFKFAKKKYCEANKK